MPLSSPAGYRKRDNFTGRQFGSSGLTLFVGKTNASVTKGTLGSVSRYSGTQGSETDTGKDDSVFCRFADLESGKWCIYCKVGKGYEMLAGEC